MKKKGVFTVAALLLSVVLTAALCACSGLFRNAADNSYPSSVATEQGTYGSEESFLAAQDTPSTHERRLYEEAKAEGYTGTFYEFLQSLGMQDDTAYVQSALRSVVSIRAAFSGGVNLGSGVIYDLDKAAGDAYIVTNYHVLADDLMGMAVVSDEINVYLYGGEVAARAIPASYVGGAMEYDLAVLRVEDSAVLRESSAAEFTGADSDSVTPGETVYAIGNPEGEGISVTRGIVSVDAEYINLTAADGKTTIRLLEIRTDAAVNHGNSGGGLFNAAGELIGIVNARSEDDGVVSFGYAIPSNLALAVAQNILDNSSGTQRGAVRAMLGVTCEVADSRGIYDEETGKMYIEEKIVVSAIETGSVAAEGGLDIGDTILRAEIVRNGKTVRGTEATRLHKMTNLMFDIRMNDTLRLTVSRGGETQELLFSFDGLRDFVQYS